MRSLRGPIALWRDVTGASIVELALLSPILLVALAGTVDCARLLSTKLRLQQAAERTAEMATAGGVASAAFGSLQNEAAAAAKVPASSVAVSYWLECDGSRQTDFQGTCGAGQQVARFTSVSIAGNYSPSFPWLLGANVAVNGRASVRVQ